MPPTLTGSSINQVLGTSNSFSHAVGAGSNQIVYVAIFTRIPKTYTVTYGGAAMTLLDSSALEGERIDVYYLINPPIGSSTVSVSWSISEEVTVIAASYKDVNLAAPHSTTTKSSGSASNPSYTVNSTAYDLIVNFIMAHRSTPIGQGITPTTAGMSTVASTTGVNSTDGLGTGEGLFTIPGAASIAHTFTLTASGSGSAWSVISFSIHASPSSAFLVFF